MARAVEAPGADEDVVTILCVASEPGMAALTATHLEQANDRIETLTATTTTAAFETVQEHDPDCVVSEYQMDGPDGIVLLEGLRAGDPELPVVLFAQERSAAVASEAITSGVTDYVERTGTAAQYDRLAARLLTAVEASRQRRLTTATADRAETALEPAVDPVLLGVDGACVYANEAACSLFAGDPVGQLIDDLLELGASSVDLIEAGDRQLRTTSLAAGSVPVTVTSRRLDWRGETGAAYVCPPTTDRGREVADETHSDLLAATFESAPDGILVLGPDGSVLTYNDQFPSLWGLDPATLDSAEFDRVRTLLSAAAGEDVVLDQSLTDALDATEPRRTEVALADGRVLEQHVVPLGEQNRLGTAVYCRDLSEIQLGSAREPIFDHMSDAVCILDTDWRFTYANDDALELTNRSREELLGSTLWEAFPGVVGTELETGYREAVETGETFRTETYYEPLEMVLEIRAFPSETGIITYFRDISHQRAVKEELRDTIDELKSLYELVGDQSSTFEDKRERLLELGTQYLDLPYGFVSKIADDEQRIVESTGDHDLLQPGECCPLAESYCRKTVASDRGFLAVDNTRSEGWEDDLAYETFELGTYIGAKLLVNGELYGTLCFASTEPHERDFSDSEQTLVEVMARWLSYEYGQRAYREQLEAQNDRLEQFASMVSHDLRNPLNVAMSRVELLGDEVDSNHLDSIAQAHSRMEELIEDILLLARQDGVAENPPTVALDAVATRAWEGVETGDATLSVTTTDSLPADESLLAGAFENLYRNAVEHGTDDAAALTVTVGSLNDGFYVADDGTGIPPADCDHIFEEGISTATGGNGLGLSIVSEVANAHGWQVTATESDAGGARFEFTGVK